MNDTLRQIAKRASGRPGAALALFVGRNREDVENALATIASESGRELQRIDLAALVSKYAGEAEKSLNRVFEDAERGGAVLVFDEADSLFGRESEKESAPEHRRIVEYLVKRKERLAGAIVLVATDAATLDERKRKGFDYVLRFDEPRPSER